MADPTKHKLAFPFALALFAGLNLMLFALLDKGGFSAKRPLTLQALNATGYEKRQEGPWVWWVTKTYLSQPRTPDVVLLGSSQMGSAIFSAEANHRMQVVDTTDQRQVTSLKDAIAEATGKLSGQKLAPDVFNFSMGGAMVSDHYLLANTLFNEQKPKVVIIGVNPRDFIDNSLPAASATDSYHFLSRYADLDKLAPVSYEDGFGYLDYLISRNLPIKRLQILTSADVPPPLGNKASFTNPEGKGAKKENNKVVATQVLRAISGSAGDVRKGEWALPATPPYLYMDNSKEYIKRYKTTKARCLPGQKAYFVELLAMLKKQNIKTVVVGMPSQDCNRNLLPQSFWSEFRQFLAVNTEASGGTYIDLFDDPRFVATKDYLDTVHLNRWGGAKLVNIIAQELAKDSSVVTALNSNHDNGGADNRATATTQSSYWH